MLTENHEIVGSICSVVVEVVILIVVIVVVLDICGGRRFWIMFQPLPILYFITGVLDLAMNSADYAAETVPVPLRLNAKSVASSSGSESLGSGLSTSSMLKPIPVTRQVDLTYIHTCICTCICKCVVS